MRSQPIFRPSVYATHVFTTVEVNVSKKRIFQPNVFNTLVAFTPTFNPPVVFNNELRLAMGGSWDWDDSNSKLKWIYSIINTQPTWSTGFRVVKNN